MNRGTPERNLQVEGSNAPGQSETGTPHCSVRHACADLPAPAQHLFVKQAASTRANGIVQGAVTRIDVDNGCSTQSNAVPSS